MHSKRLRKKQGQSGPEAGIQADIIKYLTLKDWYCKETHGNIFQFGLPDLYICHRRYGARWVECKNPDKYSFTPAQIETFNMFAAKSVGIWILVAANDIEYEKLFLPPNWHYFLGRSKVL